MIRINLLKKGTRKSAPEPQKSGLPRIFVILIICIGIAALGAGGYWLSTMFKSSKVSAPKSAIVEPTIPNERYLPSTHSKPMTVEETVSEVDEQDDKLHRRGMLDISYMDMAYAEKLNYEMLFCRNVCDLLAKVVPTTIGLTTLEIDSFTTIRATAYTPSREVVAEMLSSLRNEKATILPKPATSISAAERGFLVRFACTVELGLNLADPFVDLGLTRLPNRSQMPGMIDSLMSIARTSKVTLSPAPIRTKTETSGSNFTYRYHLQGTASYPGFVSYIRGLTDKKIPCAFEHLKLRATASETVVFEADIVFTVLE
jgi:hypothetical protein